MLVSVVIPTHNPDPARLDSVLRGLRAQTLPIEEWETIVVDNASTSRVIASALGPAAPSNIVTIQEPTLGLAYARRRGLLSARGRFAVLVDDDNVLAPDYLAAVTELFQAYPNVGLIGGKAQPAFAVEPPAWLREFLPLLAVRDLGDAPLVSAWNATPQAKEYPSFAPIGAGMALRREAWTAWLDRRKTAFAIPDRVGSSLSSSGDNDIVLCALRGGWEVGYFPQLRLTHLIPEARLDSAYLERLNRATQQSWMRVLALHGVSPWGPLTGSGAWIRKLKAWFAYRPWRSVAARIRWHGACGHFEGRVAPAENPVARPTSPGRQFARKLGLGRLNYLAWHAPLAQLRRSRAAGGPVEQWMDRQGQRAMIRAAAQLAPHRFPLAEDRPELHLLTGRKFWYQTAFCLHSLELHSGETFRTVIQDDGTLDEASVAQLQSIFPHAKIERSDTADARVIRHLPADRFPVLHERRRHYPQLRKLIDVHATRSGWRLVLDSDMLFFRKPHAVLDWLRQPERPLHLCDIGDAYGYSPRVLAEVAGSPLPSRVNVGLLGLDSSRIDWDELEQWSRQLIAAEGTSYYLEQALVALMLSRENAARLDAHEYVVCPSREACFPPRAVLHHYVAESKRWYFRHTWQVCRETEPCPVVNKN